MPTFARSTLGTRFLVVLTVALAAAAGMAQQARDVTARPAATGVIEGIVISDGPDGRPLRRVTLELVPGVAQRFASTDADGRFVMADLPAGRYFALRAAHPAHVDTAYGQKRIGGPGAPIVLTEGQRLTVVIRMHPAATISGVVMNQGRPAVGTSVSATRVTLLNGQRILRPGDGSRATTDDRGVFRLAGLSPGDYIITAAPPFIRDDEELRTATDEELKWAQLQLQSAPGTTSRPAAPPASGRPVAYLPVHYPDAVEIHNAGLVTIAAGEERHGIDFSLRLVPTATVEGRIVVPDGQPMGSVDLVMAPTGEMEAALADPFRNPARNVSRPAVVNGSFSVKGVRPGRYTLSARVSSRDSPSTGTWWAIRDIHVDGADLSGIELRPSPGLTVTGRVAFEDGRTTPPSRPHSASVALSPVPNGVGLGGAFVPPATVAADGTFFLSGVPPGFYMLQPSASVSAPPIWLLKSARVGEVDVLDRPVEVKPGEHLSGVAITFTNRAAEISGTLLDESGRPATDFHVLLFPANKALWAPRSRARPRYSQTGSDGKFRFVDLLAGDWQLAAVSDFDDRDLYDAGFLSQLAASATTIKVGEGERKIQDLKFLKR
jgi:hypothetical protein